MKLLQRTTVALAAVAALAAVPVQEARADILPAVGTPTITPLGNGLFRWEYTILLSSTQNVNPGDFFVIYDFGAATDVLVPAGWGFSSDPTAPAQVLNGGIGTTIPNQTDALNWTFTYNGATPILGQDNVQTSLGVFSLTSTVGTSQIAAFVGHGTDRVTNLANGNITNVLVPTATPEPASLVLLGTGMLGIVGIARRRKNS